MKKMEGFTTVAITAALFATTNYSAVADSTPSPSPTFDSFKAAHEQYKKDRDAYVASVREREIKMRIINATFKSSVDKATYDAKTAMNSATTPEQKNSINAARRAAVAAAIVARESAIEGLEVSPIPPVEPTKAQKSAPFGTNEPKAKQKR